MRSLTLFAGFLLLSACATGGDALRTEPRPGLRQISYPEPTEEDRALALEVEQAAERHLAARARYVYSLWTEGTSVEGAPEEPLLLEPAAWEAVRRVRLAASAKEGPRWSAVERYLAAMHRERGTEASRRILEAAWEQARVREGEATWQLSALDERLAAARDAARRREIGAAAEAALAEVAALQREVEKAERGTLDDLVGAGPELAPFGAVDTERLVALAESLLSETDDLWRLAFGAIVERALGLGLDEVRWVDLPRLARSPALEVPLRTTTPLAALEATLGPLWGEALPAVHRKEGEWAVPLPLALPLDGSAHLVLPPAGGTNATSLFREAGIALHLRERQRLLGGAEVFEVWAAFFSAIPAEPAWLREQAGLTEAEATSRSLAQAVWRLFHLRTRAAWILHELGEGEPELRQALERAWAFPVDAEDASRMLLERESAVDAAAPFVGALVAARVRAELGDAFWRKEDAGSKLDELLRQDGLDGLLASLGESEPRIDSLVAWLEASLQPLVESAP